MVKRIPESINHLSTRQLPKQRATGLLVMSILIVYSLVISVSAQEPKKEEISKEPVKTKTKIVSDQTPPTAPPVPSTTQPTTPVPSTTPPVPSTPASPPPVKAGSADAPELILRQALQTVTLPSKNNLIELFPDKVSVKSTVRFIQVSAKSEGKVKWYAFNTGRRGIEFTEVPNTKTIQVFPNYDTDDVITIYAYTSSQDGTPSSMVSSVITVTRKSLEDDLEKPDDQSSGSTNKEPPKTPTTPPVKDQTQTKSNVVAHFTIITDDALKTANPAFNDIVNSPDLKSGIEARGSKLWIYEQNKDADQIKKGGFDQYIKLASKIPMYVIQNSDAEVLDSGPLPNSLVSILNTVDKFKKDQQK